MTTDGLVLSLLREMRRELTDIRDIQREHGVRLTEIASGVSMLKRDRPGVAKSGVRTG